MLATYLIYYQLYFLSTCLLQLKYNWWNYYCYTIICRITWSHKVACGTIWRCATNKNNYYCKCAKVYWAKLSCFSWFSRVPWKFSHEYKHLSLIILNIKHLWPRQCKSISAKTSMGLKPWMFSPANLSLSKVYQCC